MKLKSFLFFLLLGSVSILQASDRSLIKIETEPDQPDLSGGG